MSDRPQDDVPPLDLDRLRSVLADSSFKSLNYVASTGSTNADLMAAPPAHMAVLLAGEQTAGRGRLGRAWSSPQGAQLILSLSLIVEPRHLDRLGLLPLAIGLALVDCIEPARLKWPNDVLIGDKKLAGILAEAAPLDGDRYRVVVGCGLNTFMKRSELPVPHATSLEIEGIAEDPTELAARILKSIETRVTQWLAAEAQLLDDYRQACDTIGRRVRVTTPSGEVYGTAEAVDAEGRVVVDGHALSAGDVTHLRPAR